MAITQENKMKITLINYTGMGLPATFTPALLIFTKNTRLKMSSEGLHEIMQWPSSKIEEELEYMSNTIPSSWEFVDYTFMVEDVTRAYTHQAVRTRAASYAQQTMRVLNVDGFTYGTGPSIANNDELKAPYEEFMMQINDMYNWLIENGAEIEDARGVLPTNIHTNIVIKFNLRTLAEVLSKRSSPRTQGEYRQVLNQMAECVLDAHPWAQLFLRNRKMDAAAKLDEFIKFAFANSDVSMNVDLDKTDLLKAVDILRG